MPKKTRKKNAYLFRDFARFYDWSYEGLTEDISFFLLLAKRYRECSVLELGCGTGRVSFELAKAGVNVTGIDLSEHMLSIAKSKLKKKAGNLQESLDFMRADMSNFSLKNKYSLVLVPQAALFHLHSSATRLACLSLIHEHLKKNGTVVLDLVAPSRMANQKTGQTELIKEGVNSITGKLTRELNKKLSLIRDNHSVTVEHTYIETQSDGSELIFLFVQKYTWVSKEEMLMLLVKAGFHNIEIFGDYDYTPYENVSRRMIFTARKV